MTSGEIYSQYGIEHFGYIDKIFDRHLKELTWNSNEKILDLGSASGKLLIDVLLQKFPNDIAEVVASDQSEEMVACCNKNLSSKDKCYSIKLDIETKVIPVELENRFDHLFSTYCLMYIHDLRQSLENCFSLLKPGGELFFIFGTINIMGGVHRIMCEDAKWLRYLGYRKDFKERFHNISDTRKTISEYFEESGFDVKLCEFDPDCQFTFPSMHNIFKILESFDDGLSKIPTAELETYRQDYIKAFLSLEEVSEQSNMNIIIREPTVIILAKKPIC